MYLLVAAFKATRWKEFLYFKIIVSKTLLQFNDRITHRHSAPYGLDIERYKLVCQPPSKHSWFTCFMKIHTSCLSEKGSLTSLCIIAMAGHRKGPDRHLFTRGCRACNEKLWGTSQPCQVCCGSVIIVIISFETIILRWENYIVLLYEPTLVII